MSYSRTLRDGTARDEALRRRVATAREAGMGPKPKPDAEQPAEPKVEEQATG